MQTRKTVDIVGFFSHYFFFKNARYSHKIIYSLHLKHFYLPFQNVNNPNTLLKLYFFLKVFVKTKTKQNLIRNCISKVKWHFQRDVTISTWRLEISRWRCTNAIKTILRLRIISITRNINQFHSAVSS